jgi:hypothetical protein
MPSLWAIGIDHVAEPAMVDSDRKGGAVKIGRDVEPEILDHQEESVAMIESVGRGEFVGARHIGEIERVDRRRRDQIGWQIVEQPDETAAQHLGQRIARRGAQIGQGDVVAQRVEGCRIGAGQIGDVAGLGHRIAVEHQGGDAIDQCPQIEHRAGLDLDEGAPVERAPRRHRQREQSVDHDIIGAVLHALGKLGQRQRRRLAAEAGVVLVVGVRIESAGGVVTINHHAGAVDPDLGAVFAQRPADQIVIGAVAGIGARAGEGGEAGGRRRRVDVVTQGGRGRGHRIVRAAGGDRDAGLIDRQAVHRLDVRHRRRIHHRLFALEAQRLAFGAGRNASLDVEGAECLRSEAKRVGMAGQEFASAFLRSRPG